MAETALAWAITTTARIKTLLGIATANTTDDDKITLALNYATDWCETVTNRKLMARSTATTEYYDGRGDFVLAEGHELWTREWPIAAAGITSIYDDTQRSYGASTQVTTFLVKHGRYIRLSDIAGPGTWNDGVDNIKLTYTPGYSSTTVPQDLVWACTLIALDFYRLQANRGVDLSSMSIGSESIGMNAPAINPVASEILAKFTRGYQSMGDKQAWWR